MLSIWAWRGRQSVLFSREETTKLATRDTSTEPARLNIWLLIGNPALGMYWTVLFDIIPDLYATGHIWPSCGSILLRVHRSFCGVQPASSFDVWLAALSSRLNLSTLGPPEFVMMRLWNLKGLLSSTFCSRTSYLLFLKVLSRHLKDLPITHIWYSYISPNRLSGDNLERNVGY